MTVARIGAGRWVAGLLGVLAVVGAVAGVLYAVPDPLPLGSATVEWSFGGGQLAAVLCAVAALGLGAAAASWTAGSSSLGESAGTASALAASILAIAWAGLAPAVWAGDPAIRAVALVVACLLPAGLLHLALALAPGSTRAPRAASRAIRSSYLLLGVLAVAHVLSRDPFLDPGCLVRCRPVSPVIPSQVLAAGTGTALRLTGAALTAAALLVAIRALAQARTATTRTALLLAAGCALVELVWGLAPGARPGLGPMLFDLPRLLEVRGATSALLGLGLLVAALDSARRRAGLRRLAREITEVTPPHSLSALLRTRLGDPDTEVAYHVPYEPTWVDEHGRPVDPAPPRGSQTAWVRREGSVVARITFDAPGARARDLEDVLGPAALLALEAERTRAEQLLRLTLLQETRRRAVEASDLARRRAERDLHDGAQHLLLGATFVLREAVELARGSGDDHRAAAVAHAIDDVTAAARELREVAHGIYPVLLGDAGLVPALQGLALESAVPTTLDATGIGRLDASTELTAYRAAALAVRAAEQDPVHLALQQSKGRLLLQVHGARLHPVDEVVLVDRARALGGTVEATDEALRLELPCG